MKTFRTNRSVNTKIFTHLWIKTGKGILKWRTMSRSYKDIVDKAMFCLFVCLFGFIVLLENFSLIWRRPLAGEGLLFTYARHSWPFSSEGFLACHTYCDTGHPSIIVISEDPWHSHVLPRVGSRAVTTCFYDLGLSRLGFKHPSFRLRGERSNPMRHRPGHKAMLQDSKIILFRTNKQIYI